MSSHSTRWTIIQGAARGSSAQQSEFVRLYGPVIRAYLRARWRETPLFNDVDDAAQQVFLDCFKANGALTRVDPKLGFRGFLYGVVRNVARAAERKRGRSKEQPAGSAIDLDAIASKEDSCGKVFDRAWASALMRDAAELHLTRARASGPEAVRRHKLLALRYGESLPIREIAKRWDVDAAVLHREYPKAREEFKRALLDVVRELHGGDSEEEAARLLGLFS